MGFRLRRHASFGTRQRERLRPPERRRRPLLSLARELPSHHEADEQVPLLERRRRRKHQSLAHELQTLRCHQRATEAVPLVPGIEKTNLHGWIDAVFRINGLVALSRSMRRGQSLRIRPRNHSRQIPILHVSGKRTRARRIRPRVWVRVCVFKSLG